MDTGISRGGYKWDRKRCVDELVRMDFQSRAEERRVYLVESRSRALSPDYFEIVLAQPLELKGEWTCHVEFVSISYYNTTTAQLGNIPNPVFIVCDFVEGSRVNDSMQQVLGVVPLFPVKEKGYKNVSLLISRPKQYKVTKEYISRIALSLVDQKLSSLPEGFLRGDTVIELVFSKDV